VLGDLTQITWVGHPTHCDESFQSHSRAVLRKDDARLTREWNSTVISGAGEGFARAKEEALVAKAYDVNVSDSPLLIVTTAPAVSDRLVVRIPDACLKNPEGQRAFLAEFERTFDQQAVRSEWMQLGGDVVALRRVLEQRLARFIEALSKIEAGRHRGTIPAPMPKRRRGRSSLSPGWLHLADAARKHKVDDSTAHRYARRLRDDERKKDPESNEVVVLESAFLRVMSKFRAS